VWRWQQFTAGLAGGLLLGVVATVAVLGPRPVVPRVEQSSPQTAPATSPATAPTLSTHVYFSPPGGATEAVLRELGRAKRRVRVQAYSFASPPIAQAVVDAKARGIEVTVILDRSQESERYTSATFLHNHGVPVFIDAEHSIAHNKVILIDADTVITGSFNFTRAAEERNAENLLILHDADLAAKCRANFDAHLAHSRRYSR
jgi:phosphatidylserine/phosphatidylglycerophosphate/cardiolipin synthase-like enzyme